MTITGPELRGYVNASTADDQVLTDLASTATTLVTDYIGSATVPADVVKSAELEVGAKLYARRNASLGASPDDSGGYAVPAPRDPMVTAYPLLHRYMVAGL